MTSAGFFIPATVLESLAVILFNGFATVFLLPVLLMDLLCFLPAGLYHLLTGKARLRILASSLRGFLLWLLGFCAALWVIHTVEATAVEMLYRTLSGVAAAALGTLHTLISFVRYRGSLREYYYSNVLEKNLSARGARECAALRRALQTGELNAAEVQADRSRDFLSRRMAREVAASRQEESEWSEGVRQEADVYFL